MGILPQLKRYEGKEEEDSWLEYALSEEKVTMDPGRGVAGDQQPPCMVLPPKNKSAGIMGKWSA